MYTVTRYHSAFAASWLIFLCFFQPTAWAGQTRTVGAGSFSSSTDVKELISQLHFKLDPEQHSIVIFGFRWKGKSSGKQYPLTELAGGTIDVTISTTRVYTRYRLNDLSENGIHPLAQSNDLTLYVIFEKVYQESEPEKIFKFYSFRSGDFLVENIRETAGNTESFAIGSSVKVGTIHYTGNYVFDVDPDSKEAPVALSEPSLGLESNEVRQWIGENFPTIPGFRLEE